jgi:hypothetical protein
MAKIWTTASCKPGKIRRVHRGCWGFRRRLSVVPPVEFSQCTRSEPDLGQVVPKLWGKVGKSLGSASRLNLLAGAALLRRFVCASLAVLLYRHERPLLDNGHRTGVDEDIRSCSMATFDLPIGLERVVGCLRRGGSHWARHIYQSCQPIISRLSALSVVRAGYGYSPDLRQDDLPS